MKLTKSNTTAFPQLEEGTYVGRLYSMIYLGTQVSEYQGSETESQKINVSWEIPEERLEFKDKDLPRSISKEYTFSFHEKANFLKDVQIMLGRDIEKDEEIDLKDLLGKTCLISVGTTSGGKAKVTGVAKLMKGQKCGAAENTPVIFDNDENFDPEAFEKLPKFIKEKIVGAPEYSELVGDLTME